MNEQELKRRAQSKRRIPEWLWRSLVHENYVEDAIIAVSEQSPEAALDFIIKEVDRRAAELIGEGKGNGAKKQDRGMNKVDRERDAVRVSLKPLEAERQAALEEYLAMCAACDAYVYSFRKETMKGGLLSDEEARELVRSPAAGVLNIREFEDWKIPIVGHTAIVKDDKIKGSVLGETYSATLHVDPPGREVPKSVPVLYGQSGGWRPSVLEFPAEEGEVERVRIWGKSLLDELRAIGEKLSGQYRWRPAQAVWFVLTGGVPSVPSLVVEREFYRSGYHEDHVIRIEAPPWITDETVKDAFHRARTKSLGGPSGTLKSKGLSLLRFVTERTDPIGLLKEGARIPNPDDWFDGLTETEIERELVAEQAYMKAPQDRELLKEWNALHPEWSYKEVRLFRRDYNRMWRTVAFGPPYKW